MKLIPILSVLTAGVLMLSACDKTPASSDQPSQTQSTTQNPQSTATQNAPTTVTYLDYQVKAMRTLVVRIMSEDYELTQTQMICLLDKDGTANYLSVLEPHFKKILSEEDFKEADEFFASQTGQKFNATIDMLFEKALKGEPSAETDEQKALLAEVATKPFFKKAETHANQMSEEEALAFLQSFYDKEVARCGVEPAQAKKPS